nr:uncharacterized protein LOC129051765 [Pongo abelii]
MLFILVETPMYNGENVFKHLAKDSRGSGNEAPKRQDWIAQGRADTGDKPPASWGRGEEVAPPSTTPDVRMRTVAGTQRVHTCTHHVHPRRADPGVCKAQSPHPSARPCAGTCAQARALTTRTCWPTRTRVRIPPPPPPRPIRACAQPRLHLFRGLPGDDEPTPVAPRSPRGVAPSPSLVNMTQHPRWARLLPRSSCLKSIGVETPRHATPCSRLLQLRPQN